MHIHKIHSFDLDAEQMKNIQLKLKEKIEIIPYSQQPKVVCGVDLAYFADQAVAVIVVMDYKKKQIIETISHMETVLYDYMPGFLAFRELPVFLKAWEKLNIEPDLVFFDGNGILHPRRVGIATHASFFIDKPTVGIAKNHFIGSYDEPKQEKGNYTFIWDHDEIVGAVLRTRTNVKPVYISVGNRIDLKTAIDFTMHFVGTESRIPEIIRQADILTKKLRKDCLGK